MPYCRRGLTVCPLLEDEENLRLLNFQHNLIRKIQNLSHLRKLIFLDLYDNHIEEINGLSCLKSLRVLMLGKNRYVSLSMLLFCAVIKIRYCSVLLVAFPGALSVACCFHIVRRQMLSFQTLLYLSWDESCLLCWHQVLLCLLLQKLRFLLKNFSHTDRLCSPQSSLHGLSRRYQWAWGVTPPILCLVGKSESSWKI